MLFHPKPNSFLLRSFPEAQLFSSLCVCGLTMLPIDACHVEDRSVAAPFIKGYGQIPSYSIVVNIHCRLWESGTFFYRIEGDAFPPENQLFSR